MKKFKPDIPEFYVDARKKYRWRVKAANGEIYGASHQGFSSYSAAKKNFNRLRILEDI